MYPKKLWWKFGIVVTLSFAVLPYYGWEIYQQAPPIPDKVTAESDSFLTKENILTGQNVWMSLGGHEMGSIWGHGSYVAPDWGAVYLHREAEFILGELARKEYGLSASELSDLREDYAMQPLPLKDQSKIDDLISFFFWISWTQSTERPGETITYTNNWPPEELAGNKPTPNLLLWTGFSVILLIAGIGALSAYYASQREEEHYPPVQDPLKRLAHSPSMKATYKFFLVVALLFLLQIAMGVLTAHYGVEGSGLFGIPLAEIMPYSVTRTWHIQLAIFWIATYWLCF